MTDIEFQNFIKIVIGFDTIQNSEGFPYDDIPSSSWEKTIPSIRHFHPDRDDAWCIAFAKDVARKMQDAVEHRKVEHLKKFRQ